MKSAKTKLETDKPDAFSSNHFPIVGIGASAGGLEAFKKLLNAIPEDSGMAYVLVQHLKSTHESLLPELLQKATKIPVLEISDDIKILPNHIYVIPSNKMLTASDGVLQLSPREDKNKVNLLIDIFFTSLAEVHQTQAIGVVLSGTASDGTLGLKAIKEHGGITFAQNEASAAYNGMPHNAIQAGVVDFILPPEKIPHKIIDVLSTINGSSVNEENQDENDEGIFKQIIYLLRVRKGTDFTYYKQTTIRRRILRRMALSKNENIASYLKYLRENKTEQDILYQDLLIPVTYFFRDAKSFEYLSEKVFPKIIKNKAEGEPIRLWIAGCSTGKEAYSMAIALKEILDHKLVKVQIFATDISEPAIAKARSGIYLQNDVEGISPERLNEFFTKSGETYQVNKNIRDMCIFSVHNFLKDPPFSKLDFVSCRNVLIYMEGYLQKKALIAFHYALNTEGFLFLGKSETVSNVSELFSLALKSDRLFIRKDVPSKLMYTNRHSERHLKVDNIIPVQETTRIDFKKTTDDIVLNKYNAPGVVVNEAMDIVYFRGYTGNYLEVSPGKPSLNLFKMAKDGLSFELRNILHKAQGEKATILKENVSFQINGKMHQVTLEAIPIQHTIEPHYLILFHEEPSFSASALSEISKRTKSGKTKTNDYDLKIQNLEQVLSQVREDMRSITEEQEAVNEELQSANEELLSGSEELQSLNEELETSKEELQSTNEELIVVNQEMVNLNGNVQKTVSN